MTEIAAQSSEIVIFLVTGIIFFTLLGCFLVYFIIMYNKKQLEQKRLEAQYQQAILESQTEIQQELLNHVSSEIHDNLGQVASLLKIQLHTLPLEKDSPALPKLNESKELLGKLILDLKLLSVSLNTDFIAEAGLVAALQKETERINQLGTVAVALQGPAEALPLDAGKTLFLYRMAQEILNNMLKHARCTQIGIRLSYSNGTLVAVFEDNGVGFAVDETLAQSASKQQSGLRNLQKRCEMIHGSVEINSELGRGSKFVITLPV